MQHLLLRGDPEVAKESLPKKPFKKQLMKVIPLKLAAKQAMIHMGG